MIEFQHFSHFFNQIGAAAALILVFWWWYKSENKRIDKMISAMIEQHKENNTRIDKMIDMQREDSQRNFKIMRENQDVLLLQTRSIEQLGEGFRDLNKRFEDFIYKKSRRANEPDFNAVKN